MGRLRVYGRIARVLLVVALGLSMAGVFGVFERLGNRQLHGAAPALVAVFHGAPEQCPALSRDGAR
jgi:hypothetical protein